MTIRTNTLPLRESAIFSLADALARLLGLLFLARFVALLGLEASAAFRIALPLLGLAAAFATIGLPQALTRYFATDGRARIPVAQLRTALLAAVLAALLSLGGWAALSWISARTDLLHLGSERLLATAIPLLLLLCLNGSLRGVLLGLGSTYAPAFGQIVEVTSRLCALLTLHEAAARVDSIELGLFVLTAGEAVVTLYLSLLLRRRLRRRGIDPSPTPRIRLFRDLLAVLRMSLGPTGQSLLATLGYALELPLAHRLLAETHGPAVAEQLVAGYSAVALPLLCAPMVLTDGLATALLPAAARQAKQGRATLGPSLQRLLLLTLLVALPATALLFLGAPALTAAFGVPAAATALLPLAWLTFPLYLQAPLSALLQAHGYSRALLAAGGLADAARLGALLLTGGDLPSALAAAVYTQTSVLLLLAAYRARAADSRFSM